MHGADWRNYKRRKERRCIKPELTDVSSQQWYIPEHALLRSLMKKFEAFEASDMTDVSSPTFNIFILLTLRGKTFSWNSFKACQTMSLHLFGIFRKITMSPESQRQTSTWHPLVGRSMFVEEFPVPSSISRQVWERKDLNEMWAVFIAIFLRTSGCQYPLSTTSVDGIVASRSKLISSSVPNRGTTSRSSLFLDSNIKGKLGVSPLF